MKNRLIVSIITVVLVVLSVSRLFAQDEGLTLDGIAGQLSALTERVTEMFTAQADLMQRVEAVETAIAPAPTPTATSTPAVTVTPTPTPGPEITRLQFSDIDDDHDANEFAARKKYGEYEGKIVEIEGTLENIGNNWDGRGFPYISIGFVPEVHCNLEEVEEEILLALREGQPIVIMGEFTIWEELDAYLFIIMEDCRIVPDEGADPAQE